MPSEKSNIASTIIPQSNYRKSNNKKLNQLKTDLPPIGKNHTEKENIIEKIKTQIILIHEIVLKNDHTREQHYKKK